MDKSTIIAVFLSFSIPVCSHAQDRGTSIIWTERIETRYDWLNEGCTEEVIADCKLWLEEEGMPLDVLSNILTLQGNALKRLGAPKEALKSHNKALSIRTNYYGKTSEEVAKTCQNLANCYWDLGYVKEAANFYQKGLAIKRQHYPQNDDRLVKPIMNLADAYLELDKVPEASQLFNEALSIRAEPRAQKDLVDGLLHAHLAKCHYKLGEYYKAISALSIAWGVFSRSTDALPLEKGRCLLLTGDSWFELGDAETALQYYSSSFAYFQESNLDKTALLLSLGKLHRFRGDSRTALECLNEAMNICLESQKTSQLNIKLLQSSYLEIGSIYLDQEELEGAMHYFNKVLVESDKVETTLFTSALLKAGLCSLLQGSYNNAKEKFKKALYTATNSQDTGKIFSSFYYLGETALLQTDTLSAINYYSLALNSLGKQGSRPYEVIQVEAALAAMYKTLASTKNNCFYWEKALATAHNGIEKLQALKGLMRSPQSEIDLQERFYQLYNVAISATVAIGAANANEQAFSLTEQYRANLFQRFLKQAENSSGQIASDEGHLHGLLAADVQRKNKVNGSPVFPLHPREVEHLDSLMLSYQTQLQLLRQREESTTKFLPVHTSELRQRLTSKQVMVAYHWADDYLFAFILTRDTFAMRPILIEKDFQSKIIQLFSAYNQNPSWLRKNDQVAFSKLSHEIYAKIVAPLRPWLKEEIIVVPDAWLYYLPFDGLVTVLPTHPELYWQHRYMVHTHDIGYANSATTFSELQGSVKGNKTALLGVAPAFSGDIRGLNPLYYNEDEVSMAKNMLGGETITGKFASKERFMHLAKHSDILLFSTHAVLDDRNPNASFLAFAQPSDNAGTGVLHSWEIYQLRLHANLVILSACQTASGRMYRGEGLLSIARAFQNAGAKTVVASLWNVDDKQTPLLMKHYFANMSNGLGKVKSLAAAKRQYLANAPSIETHPFFWSGFISMGDTYPLVTSPVDYTKWFLVAGMAVLVLATLKGLKKLLVSFKK